MDEEFIPLLSGRKFSDFTPEEFKAHVISLYFKREKKKTKSTKSVKEFTFRVNKKGTLCLSVKRKPKWLTYAEIDAISSETKIDLSIIHNKLIKAKIEIRDVNQMELF